MVNPSTLSKDELVNLIKKVNTLLGAVDGNTIEKLRKFIEIYNVTAWQVERYSDLIHFLLDRVGDDDKKFVEKEISRIRKKVKDVIE